MKTGIAFNTLIEKLEAILLEENTLKACVKLINEDELNCYITVMLIAANNANSFLKSMNKPLTLSSIFSFNNYD